MIFSFGFRTDCTRIKSFNSVQQIGTGEKEVRPCLISEILLLNKKYMGRRAQPLHVVLLTLAIIFRSSSSSCSLMCASASLLLPASLIVLLALIGVCLGLPCPPPHACWCVPQPPSTSWPPSSHPAPPATRSHSPPPCHRSPTTLPQRFYICWCHRIRQP
jgi:hypothetical protein